MPRKLAKSMFSLSDLSISIPKIFDQVQVSTSNHQKNFVALYKLQLESAKHVEESKKGTKLIGEHAFWDICFKMVARILPVKKGPTAVDRVVKFLGGYIKFINEKAAEENAPTLMNNDDSEGNTTVTRFIARLLNRLLQGFQAKDKTIRYRAVQLVAEMVANLGEIDENIYFTLRTSLIQRVTDKEPSIRTQAVIALSKLSGSEDPSELPEDEPTLIDILVESLSHDTSAEVRRVALLNTPITSTTIPPILLRVRDTDSHIRRLVYSPVLNPTRSQKFTGITHPRVLSIAQRELIVRHGLGDREPSVRLAAGALISSWLDIVVNESSESSSDSKIDSPILKVLGLFDLAESKVAEDVLLCLLENRSEICDKFELDDEFWTELTPEKAFLARVFVDRCISANDGERLESILPAVTALAFRIQTVYNGLLEDIQAQEMDDFLGDIDDRENREEARLEKEFIIAEMCKLAVNLDYADEIGRRKMFQLVRSMMSQELLPEPLIGHCLDVLRMLSANERDLIRVVVEVIHDLRDTNDSDDDFPGDSENTLEDTPVPAKREKKPKVEQTPEQRARAIAIDLRCLSLCIGMLERVNGTFEENSTLEGILGELIIPCVKQKEMVLREKGLTGLGLCCLIAKRMALNSFQLFVSQIQSAPQTLKALVLHIVFDILMVHQEEFLGRDSPHADMITNFLLLTLEREECEEIQSVLCTGIAKLLLSGMVFDERLLRNIVLMYLSPATADNLEVRQCLSYFLPVFCYSSSANQRKMQSIFFSVFEHMSTVQEEFSHGGVVNLATVAEIFADWTDPQKTVDVHGFVRDEHVHFAMAADIFKILLSTKSQGKDQRSLCQLLKKLYIPGTVDDDRLLTLKLLMHHLRSRRPLRDPPAINAFNHFDAMISKKFEKQLEDFNEEEYRKLQEFKELFDFLSDVVSEDAEEDTESIKRKPLRKRRHESVASSAADGQSSSTSNAREMKERLKEVKRKRISTSDIDSMDGDEYRTAQSRSAPPLRRSQRKTRISTKPIVEAEIDERTENQENSSPSSSPHPSSSKIRAKGKFKSDGKVGDPSYGEAPRSPFSSCDEEDEVNYLLAEE